MDKIAQYKGDVRRVLRKIMPKFVGNPIDTRRANKILDKTIKRQLLQSQ